MKEKIIFTVYICKQMRRLFHSFWWFLMYVSEKMWISNGRTKEAGRMNSRAQKKKWRNSLSSYEYSPGSASVKKHSEWKRIWAVMESRVWEEKVSWSEKSIRQLVRKAMSWDKVMKISLSQQMINCHKSFLATTLGLIMLGTKRIPNA